MTLVIMAAGMGSRFGGLKQIEPIDEYGNFIIDYSIYDAIKVGFKKVVFIIKKENYDIFRETVGKRVENLIEVEYVFQELDKLPEGYSVPEGRVKPWGTAHAILCCKDVVKEPFGIINADDYYGVESFKTLHDFLVNCDSNTLTMVGFTLDKTLSDNGSVSRGICEVKDGYLMDVVERKQIEKHGDVVEYLDGDKWVKTDAKGLASMNMWGFVPEFFDYVEKEFKLFLDEELNVNPLKCECYIPTIVDHAIKDGSYKTLMLSSDEKWYGVTYAEDKESVKAGIKSLLDSDKYPDVLWNE